jgi:hypothetical protein
MIRPLCRRLWWLWTYRDVPRRLALIAPGLLVLVLFAGAVIWFLCSLVINLGMTKQAWLAVLAIVVFGVLTEPAVDFSLWLLEKYS